jgi:2-polyprenyl-6-methoxyphenol hydroxylase-like FAD-dependent oxidoreductase
LAKAGIEVTLLDRESTIDARPRAAHFAAPAIRVLRRAGILEEIRRAGFTPKNMTWRKIDGTPIVSFEDIAHAKSPEAMAVLPLNMLGEIILPHIEKDSKITLKWKRGVVDVGQDENSAWAVVREEDGTESRIAADFLCGCDGGSSQVRKSLFGARNFPGKTWDVQLVATNVRDLQGYDFLTDYF